MILIFTSIHLLLIISFSIRLLIRNDLAPDTRLAWLFVLIIFPVLGCVLYFLFGEIKLSNKITQNITNAHASLLQTIDNNPTIIGSANHFDELPIPYQAPFRYLASINGFLPVLANDATLMTDGTHARQAMIDDIDAAQHEVCVLYYIWLDDATGKQMAQALIRAAKRGVVCRAMVDGLGSHAFLKSETWQSLQAAGVQTAVALSLKHPLYTLLTSRIDLRNHRKITLIDGKIVYCGSQNCADEAFAIKAKYAPWVDIMMRFSGSITAQMRLLFAADWQAATGETLPHLNLVYPLENKKLLAQVMGGGPTERRGVTPQFLVSIIHSAQHQLTLSTPYFVPDATVLNALCTAALRGVSVHLIVPHRNDSWIVAAASRSHYRQLLAAGVLIDEYQGGLLHAKTITVDGIITLIGSTNLDLRSFDLNFENNILFYDEARTHDVYQRQLDYAAHSIRIDKQRVAHTPYHLRIFDNLMAAVGPLL